MPSKSLIKPMLSYAMNCIRLLKNFRYEQFDSGSPSVMGIEDTLIKIRDQHCSIARYGDGELELCLGNSAAFQGSSDVLSTRLRNVLLDENGKLLCCIPDVFNKLVDYTYEEKAFWRSIMCRRRAAFSGLLSRKDAWGNAFISRCYMRYRDKDISIRAFQLWKEIFNERHLLIVEGRDTMLGVGNDLLSNAGSIRRILCPSANAFSVYDAVLSSVLHNASPSDLILISLGATATVLASDLSKAGLWAIDIGNIGAEYEWMIQKATTKTPRAVLSRSMTDAEKSSMNVIEVVNER